MTASSTLQRTSLRSECDVKDACLLLALRCLEPFICDVHIKGLSNNQVSKLFEYSMIQIDYLIMSHVFEYVILNFFSDFG